MNSYKTLQDVRDYLTPMGFHEFDPPNLSTYKNVTTIFQKIYDDEVGKKYFVDAKILDFSFTDRIKEDFHIEYECQLYQKGTHDAFNVTFIDWTIEQVESFIEDMFQNGKLDYYEEWD